MFRVRTTFNGLQGAPWLSTMHFDEAGGTAQQCVNAVGTFWAAVDAFIDSEVDWETEVDVEQVNPVNGQVTGLVSTTRANATGGVTGEALPVASQGLMRWRTGVFVAGREIRGRTFIPGLTELANDNGRPVAAAISGFNSAAIGLITDANSVFQIWSKANGQAQNVSAGSAWSEFAILRSRRD